MGSHNYVISFCVTNKVQERGLDLHLSFCLRFLKKLVTCCPFVMLMFIRNVQHQHPDLHVFLPVACPQCRCKLIQQTSSITFMSLNQDYYLFNDKKKVVFAMIGYCLLVSFFIALPPLLGWGHYTPEENGMR